MNPVFWFLVIVFAVLLWFAISFIFLPIGRFVAKKVKKISDIINYEETENEEQKENNKDE